MIPDLSVEIAGVRFKNPILTASGTCGYGEELAEVFDLSQLGGIVTKSITVKPRDGHPPPRTAETEGGMLNAIGLANVGADKFIEEKLKFLEPYDTRVVVNVAGAAIKEYVEICARLADCPRADMVELNFSCPNVAEGMTIAGSAALSERAVREVKAVFPRPVVAKLSPNVTDIGEIARACEAGGADALSLINTLVGMAVDINTGRPRLTNNTGGLSGPAVKPVALAAVYKVSQAVKVPLIGLGGISDYRDVVEFMLCGATAVQVGTALFVEPKAPVMIIKDLKKYLVENKLGSVREIIGKLRPY
ncbi:Dihydroorotate dehydrogenase B (NAD(+)), catalytic subunit [Candidatus Zixiibacteriota bacterium]|nr:Dihydroorotate dehydrogenase B (NAD(+)), catalytic subunit [candidate division Zixibacteria bacterium]